MTDPIDRRLRAADLLAGSERDIPSPARLDAISEMVMNQEMERAATRRPMRQLGLAGLGTAGLAALIAVMSIAAPGATLAFVPTPTVATDAQLAAARAVCGWPEEGTVSLEFHGNAGVAVYSSDAALGDCLVLVDGDKIVRGPFQGTSEKPRPTTTGGLLVAFGSAEVSGQKISVILGIAPAGATRVEIDGVPGAYANVVDDHFAIWLNETVDPAKIALVARDAQGIELQRDPVAGE